MEEAYGTVRFYMISKKVIPSQKLADLLSISSFHYVYLTKKSHRSHIDTYRFDDPLCLIEFSPHENMERNSTFAFFSFMQQKQHIY